MNKFTFDNHLKTHLTTTVPMALLPVRLETRYVRQQLPLTKVGHEIHTLFTQVKTPIVSLTNPSLVFENGTETAAQIKQLRSSFENNPEEILGKSEIWKLSSASSNLRSYTEMATLALRASITQIEEQQKNIKKLIENLQTESADDPNPTFISRSYTSKESFDKTKQLLENTLRTEKDLDHLTATEVLQLQEQLISHIKNLLTSFPLSSEEWNELIKPIIPSLRVWLNKASESSFKFKALPTLLKEKLIKAEDELLQIKEIQIKDSSIKAQSGVWQLIEHLQLNIKTLAQETIVDNFICIKSSLLKISETITGLISAIPSVNKDELDEIFHVQIYHAISNLLARHDLIRSKGKQQIEMARVLNGELSSKIQSIQAYLFEPACDGVELINKGILNDLYQYRDALEKITKENSFLTPSNISELLSLLVTLNSITGSIHKTILELGIIRCDDCDEVRALIRPETEKISTLLPFILREISQYGSDLDEIGMTLKEQKDRINELTKQLSQGPQVHIWFLLSELGNIMYPFPDYSPIAKENYFEVLTKSIQGGFDNLLKQLSSIEQPDETLQKAIAEIIGRSELFDQADAIHLWWSSFLDLSKHKLELIIKEFQDLHQIEESDCEDAAFDKIAPLLKYINNEMSTLLLKKIEREAANPEPPSYQLRGKWLELLCDLQDRVISIERASSEDKKKLEANLLEIVKKVKVLLKFYSDEKAILLKNNNKINQIVKLLQEKRTALTNFIKRLINVNPQFDIWKYVAFVNAYLEFKASGYPHSANIKSEIEDLNSKLNELSLPEIIQPEEKSNLTGAIFNANKMLESKVMATSTQISKNSNLLSQLIETINKLDSRNELLISEIDSNSISTLNDILLRAQKPLNQLKTWSKLESDLPSNELKLLVENLKKLLNNYNIEKNYPRRDVTVFQFQLDSFLKQVTELCTFMTINIDSFRKNDDEVKQNFDAYESSQNKLFEALSNIPTKVTDAESNLTLRSFTKENVQENQKLSFDDLTATSEIELWIRVYPDTIAIDNFDAGLTDEEIKAGKSYWEKAVNAAQNANIKLGAWRTLASVFGPNRAAWIVKTLSPVKIENGPPQSQEAHTPAKKLITFPSITPRLKLWSKAAESTVMPDRFVFCLYKTENSPPEYHFGNPLQATLQIGLDQSLPSELDTNQDGDLILGPSIKWLSDFSEAIKNGMAIRIPLGQKPSEFEKIIVLGVKTNMTNTIDPNLHLNSQVLMESLFQSHRYSSNGLSLVPPGTPTNNTGTTDSGFNYSPDIDQVFKLEIEGAPFNSPNLLTEGQDGQILAEALGIDVKTFHRVENAEGFTLRNAGIMNFCLWNATLGYYLEEMFSFFVSGVHVFKIPEDLDAIRDHMEKYVKGRGSVPTFRVGRQPYGVLPIAKLQQGPFLYYPENDADGNPITPETMSVNLDWPSNNYNGASPFFKSDNYDWLNWSAKPAFSLNLANLLIALKAKWNESVSRYIKNIDQISSDSYHVDFMKILGLHPNAAQFYNRYGAGVADELTRSTIFKDENYFSEINLTDSLPGLFGNKLLRPIIDSDLILAQLRFFDGYQQLVGNLVDSLKPSESRKLSKINATDNYIDWLNKVPIRVIHEAFRTGKMPSDSLLFLLLSNSLLNYYWDASMRIYEKMGPNQNLPLRDFRYTSLMDAAFPNWDWRSKTKAELDSHLDPMLGLSQTKIDFAKKVMTYVLKYTPAPSVKFITALKDDELPLLRKEYKKFVLGWKKSSVLALTYGVDQYNIFPSVANFLVENLDGFQYYLSDDPLVLSSDTLTPYPYISANNRFPFLFLTLDPGDLPDINVAPDNTMANYLKRPSTATNYYNETASLGKLHNYLHELSELPTVELERLMAEHLDLCSHRLDAWLLSIVNQSLWHIRETESKKGLYIGAYGYIENLKPSNTNIVFNANGDIPDAAPVLDPANQGYIHTPSLAHATTAAVLRAGFHATGTRNDLLQIDLSSTRVKKALWYLDGIRNGQELGALLGYQFERGLHENHLDSYILDFRNEFPLGAGTLAPIAGLSVETIQANNVVDGLKLIKAWRKNPQVLPPSIIGNDSSLLNKQILLMEDALDAISDLAISEGVFQLAKGNFVRSAAVQKAFNESGPIPEFEITQTPRTGQSLTHRAGFLLDPTNTSLPIEWIAVSMSPRALAEPILNRWLAEQISSPENILCEVSYKLDSDLKSDVSKSVSLLDMDLQPIDIVYLFSTSFAEPESELSKRLHYFIQNLNENLGEIIIDFHVDYQLESMTGDLISFEAISPYLRSLFKVISDCRPIHPSDLVHPSSKSSIGISLNFGTRINDLLIGFKAKLLALKQAITSLRDNLNPLVNSKIDDLQTLLWEVSFYNLPEAIFAINTSIDSKVAKECLERGEMIVKLMNERKLQFELENAKIITYSTQSLSLLDRYQKTVKTILGESFQILPQFDLPNSLEFKSALLDSKEPFLPLNSPMIIEKWLDGVGRVRERMGQMEQMLLMREIYMDYAADSIMPKPIQLPYRVKDNWIGVDIPIDYFEKHANDAIQVSRDKLSLMIIFDSLQVQIANWQTVNNPLMVTGLLCDEWTEVIPNKEETTGIAFHFDQPNMEAPQSILLPLPAYSIDNKPKWSLQHLLDSVNTAFDLAKIRAVEPDQNTTPLQLNYTQQAGSVEKYSSLHFSHLLPATLNRVVNFSIENDIALDFNINHKEIETNEIDGPVYDFVKIGGVVHTNDNFAKTKK